MEFDPTFKYSYEDDPTDPIPEFRYQTIKFVYLIKCKQFYKIGYTHRLASRVYAMRVNNPFDVEVVRVIESYAAKEIEEKLHIACAKYHHRGEWFKLTPKAVQELISLMDKYGKTKVRQH